MTRRMHALELRALDNDLWLRIKVGLTTWWDTVSPRTLPSELERTFAGLSTICLFMGYPRSGHSIVGSLIDAHPNAMMAHRLDALRFMERGVPANRVLYLMLRNSERFARTGRQLTGYRYAVPGQWQGRFERLQVLGDQEGNWTSVRLARDPALLGRLAGPDPARRRILHVIRNPFDNITTWARRSQTTLDYNIERYFARCADVTRVKEMLDSASILDVRHEEFISDFQRSFVRVLSFLGLSAEPSYVTACASIVYADPRPSRGMLPWTDAQIALVQRNIDAHAYLQGYRFDA